MITPPLTADDVRDSVRATLDRMEPNEAAEAAKWIEEHVVVAHDAEAQLALLEAWYSVNDRLRWAVMYGGES